ncbi:hypothetical protein PanWU01x14_164840 [Parasponia andersonii]|uniref:Uncharacterized protein n=1 Tax=Parasponia andersonii TaxID=3476 RepID=A0A2P5CCJ1_PARAD|nr:hypothetical protein PanWU01x14_164840 [Parasponia andersonii]
MAKELTNDSARSGHIGGKSEETIVKMLPSLSLTTTAATTFDREWEMSKFSFVHFWRGGVHPTSSMVNGHAMDSRVMNVARWDRVGMDAVRTCQQRISCLAWILGL